MFCFAQHNSVRLQSRWRLLNMKGAQQNRLCLVILLPPDKAESQIRQNARRQTALRAFERFNDFERSSIARHSTVVLTDTCVQGAEIVQHYAKWRAGRPKRAFQYLNGLAIQLVRTD